MCGGAMLHVCRRSLRNGSGRYAGAWTTGSPTLSAF
jgi:hypothetical protein